MEIASGNHMNFMSKWGLGVANDLLIHRLPLDCETSLPAAEQHRLGAKCATMWLDAFLRGSDAWNDALFGAGIRLDYDSGALSDFRSD